jgi:hypothetical protein
MPGCIVKKNDVFRSVDSYSIKYDIKLTSFFCFFFAILLKKKNEERQRKKSGLRWVQNYLVYLKIKIKFQKYLKQRK